MVLLRGLLSVMMIRKYMKKQIVSERVDLGMSHQRYGSGKFEERN